MSELESESDVIETQEVVEAEQVAEVDEQPSELATDSQGQDEQTAQDSKPDHVTQVINRKHREAKEAQERLAEAQEKLRQYESQINVAPVVPEMPTDEFDENYQRDMKNWQDAVQKKAQFDAEQGVRQQAEQQRLFEQQQKQQVELQRTVQQYTENATKLGVDQKELEVAAGTIAAYGMTDEMALHIAGDESGPLITKYLAANPAEIIALQGMNPYQAGAYLMQNIKPAAAQMKPKTTAAPAPATKVDGGSVDPELGQFKHVKGSFE